MEVLGKLTKAVSESVLYACACSHVLSATNVCVTVIWQ